MRIQQRFENAREVRVNLRALQADSDTAGGYLVRPGPVYREIVNQAETYSIMRTLGQVLHPLYDADELPVPSLETAFADAEAVTELTGGTCDVTVAFGQKTFYPHPFDKRVKMSRKLLARSEFADDVIPELLGAAIASAQETSFLQGSGSGEPLGLTVDSDVPELTTDVSGDISGDDVKDWVFSLPARFQGNARILTTTDFVKYVTQLKDGNGSYLFPDFQGRLLGKPVHYSDGMPTAFSSGSPVAGQVAAVIGDFRAGYWILDSDAVAIFRLNELYAETNQVGFHVWIDTDALAVVPTAFYKLVIHS